MDRRLHTIQHWLLNHGRQIVDLGELMDGFCVQLNAAGLELLRMNVQVRTMHPQVTVLIYIWRPQERQVEVNKDAKIIQRSQQDVQNGVVQRLSLAHGAFNSPHLRISPFWQVLNGVAEVRCRIPETATTFEFPILADLHKLGATDYLALPLQMYGGVASAISWATTKAGGFHKRDIDLLKQITPLWTVFMDLRAAHFATRSLLHTYLGQEAGETVLRGHTQRGDVERLNATIWFSDLRGFTELSSQLDSAELIAWLNEYFGAIAKPIAEQGGEILKFIGDAVLAVFPVSPQRSPAAACEAALAAARAAHLELSVLNEQRLTRLLPALRHGIALHFGEVQYGNIGSELRLDFTVIGQAVNLASRIEGLCSKLARTTIASEAVALLAPVELEELGEFELKGITEKQRVFGVRSVDCDNLIVAQDRPSGATS